MAQTRDEEMRAVAHDLAKKAIDEFEGIAVLNGEVWTYNKDTGIYVSDKGAKLCAWFESLTHADNTPGLQKNFLQHISNLYLDELQSFDLPKYLPLKNRVIDLETGDVLHHSAKLKLTFKLPIEYDEANHEKEIIEFIKVKLPDPIIRRRFLEAVAAAFVRRIRKRQIHILKGKTNTGKTTLLNLLEVLYGRENIQRKSLAQLGGADKYAAADLRSKLANISSELKEQVITNAEILKNMTGGEGMDAQKKYGQPFKVYPTCEYFAGLNNLPQIDFEENPELMNDFAFWGRFDIIPFDHYVEEKNQDKRLVVPEDPEKGKLSNSKQISGFFNILLPIVLRIYDTNETQYVPTPLETRDAFLDADPVAKFLNETFRKETRGFAFVSQTSELWESWRSDPEHKYSYISAPDFNDRVTKYGAKYTTTKDKHTRKSFKVWVGITPRSSPRYLKESANTLDTLESSLDDVLSTMSTDIEGISSLIQISNRERLGRKSVDLVDAGDDSIRSWFANPLRVAHPICQKNGCPMKGRSFDSAPAFNEHVRLIHDGGLGGPKL